MCQALGLSRREVSSVLSQLSVGEKKQTKNNIDKVKFRGQILAGYRRESSLEGGGKKGAPSNQNEWHSVYPSNGIHLTQAI